MILDFADYSYQGRSAKGFLLFCLGDFYLLNWERWKWEVFWFGLSASFHM